MTPSINPTNYITYLDILLMDLDIALIPVLLLQFNHNDSHKLYKTNKPPERYGEIVNVVQSINTAFRHECYWLYIFTRSQHTFLYLDKLAQQFYRITINFWC